MNLNRKPLIILFSLALLLVDSVNNLMAHSIQSSLINLNSKYKLNSEFSIGKPVKGANVRLLRSNGLFSLNLGKLDSNGTLLFELPVLNDGDFELQVDGGPGHRDYLLLVIRSGKVVFFER